MTDEDLTPAQAEQQAAHLKCMTEAEERYRKSVRPKNIAIGIGLAVALGLGVLGLTQLGSDDPVTEFGYGTYTVGEDVVAGAYRPTPPALGDPEVCRWSITRNDVVVRGGKGLPARIELQDGDVFEAAPTCGDWKLVK